MRFIKTIQKAGLYAHLRIGPYVCAEWNFGYLPFPLSLNLAASLSYFAIGFLFSTCGVCVSVFLSLAFRLS